MVAVPPQRTRRRLAAPLAGARRHQATMRCVPCADDLISEALPVHSLEDGTRTEGHPLARLALSLDLLPRPAQQGRLVAPASRWLLLPQEPRDGALQTRIVRKAQVTEHGRAESPV